MEACDAAVRALNEVKIGGCYANDDWLHLRGGIEENEADSAW